MVESCLHCLLLTVSCQSRWWFDPFRLGFRIDGVHRRLATILGSLGAVQLTVVPGERLATAKHSERASGGSKASTREERERERGGERGGGTFIHE